MKRILITGAAGFVGRRFVRRFLASGSEVVCVDPVVTGTGGIDPCSGWPLFEPRDFHCFRYFKQDCRDYFREHPGEYFDEIYHLAAMVGGRLMIEQQPLLVAEDLSIDAQYWRWAEQARPGKSIIFSSSAAYPVKYQRREDYQLLKEEFINFGDDIGMPDMTYGWAKLTVEYEARLAYERHGLNSVCYRPFSGYGEDQDLSYPFPSICKRALENRGEARFEVWGTGHQMRDFIYIEDCVDGVLKTKDQILNGEAINLSTGIFTSFIQLAKQISERLGFYPEVAGNSNKPEGVFARAGDTAMQERLGFRPAITIAAGIGRALEYFDHRQRQPSVRRAASGR